MSPREVEKKTELKEGQGVVSLINSSANGSNPNPRDITWRAMQQRQAGDVWIYNDPDLRRAMEASGVKQNYDFPEKKPIPGFEIPSGNGTSRVDIRPLYGAQGAALRAAVAKHLGVTEAALMAGINAEHGMTNFLPMSSPPANTGANGAGGASPGGSSGTRIALKTDPYTIRRSRAQISGDAASLEAKKKELYDAMAASSDPHMKAKKAAYDSSSAANAMWDAKNPDAQLKINRNYTLGHEVKLQVNSAAKDLLEQAKGMDPAAAMDNLRASASHPDLAKYKELQDKYKALASQGKWGAASEVLAEQHALVQGKPDLISAIAAEKALAELSGGASAANIDAAILKMNDESAKVEADLKRLEIREYDVQIIKLKPTSTTPPSTPGGPSVPETGSGTEETSGEQKSPAPDVKITVKEAEDPETQEPKEDKEKPAPTKSAEIAAKYLAISSPNERALAYDVIIYDLGIGKSKKRSGYLGDWKGVQVDKLNTVRTRDSFRNTSDYGTLEDGDTIVGFDGKKINNPEDLFKAMLEAAKDPSRKSAVITVERKSLGWLPAWSIFGASPNIQRIQLEFDLNVLRSAIEKVPAEVEKIKSEDKSQKGE